MANVFWGVHTALSNNVPGSVLAVGDSWLWYPVDNLATELGALFADETFVVIKTLVNRLGDSQAALAQDANLGPVIAIRTAGELPESGSTRWWANELHPTPKGFKRIAQNRLRAPLAAVLG